MPPRMVFRWLRSALRKTLRNGGSKAEKKIESWEADVILPQACECGGYQHAIFECPLCGTCCDCDQWALSACGHVYCVQCVVRATKASVADSKLFQCVTCELETGLKSGLTEPDVELLCARQFREKALHEVLRDYVLKQEGAVVCANCGEANVISDVAIHDDMRCLACGEYMSGKRLAEAKADKGFEKWKQRRRHATCPGCGAVVQRTVGCRNMVCVCGTNFCYRCSKVLGVAGGCCCGR